MVFIKRRRKIRRLPFDWFDKLTTGKLGTGRANCPFFVSTSIGG